MNIAPNQHEEPDVNLTPMIDVVFLLLLFFMVSTSFVRESSLKVDLPEASGEPLVAEDSPIDIIINVDGSFIIDDITLATPSKAELAKRLKAVVGDESDPHIIISADAGTKYQNIVSAMDIAKQLGYTRLTLATRQATQSKP